MSPRPDQAVRGTAPSASGRSKTASGRRVSNAPDETPFGSGRSRIPGRASGGTSHTDASERSPALLNGLSPDALHRRLAQLAAETADTHLALAEALADEAAAASPGPEAWIDIDGAASHLGMAKSRLYRLTSAGRIPHVKQGQLVRFRRSQLDAWLSEGAT